MKKKIFFYACFLLIGCFIGINIKEFKSKYVDASEEEKGLYIKYGERFPIETFNALGEKKNQKHGNTPLYKIWLYIDPNCESCIEKFPVVERLTEIMQGENIEIDILWRQEPKKTLVDTLDISKDKQYRTGSIKVLNEYPTYFITDEENIFSISNLFIENRIHLKEKIKEIVNTTNSDINVVIAATSMPYLGKNIKFSPIFNIAAIIVEIKKYFSFLFGINIEYEKKQAPVANINETLKIFTTFTPNKYSLPETNINILSASAISTATIGTVIKINIPKITFKFFLYSLIFWLAI